MTPEEIQAMAKGLAEGQAVWYILSAVIGGVITGACSYWAEKGKNRATKEDIGLITKEIEQVRFEFNGQLEDLKAYHQLRMVAAERRIQAHQEAYEMGLRLWEGITFDNESWKKLYEEARTWHRKNSLFLAEKTRKGFGGIMLACIKWRNLSEESREIQGKGWTQEMERIHFAQDKIWRQEIEPIFLTIASEVQLPDIGALEVPPPPKVRP